MNSFGDLGNLNFSGVGGSGGGIGGKGKKQKENFTMKKFKIILDNLREDYENKLTEEKNQCELHKRRADVIEEQIKTL